MSEFNFNDESFDAEVVQSPVPVLVDFWAPWCGPCQQMGPIIAELAQEYAPDKLKVAKVNVDESPETAGKYQVLSIPTFLLFSGGQVVDQIAGGMSKEALKQFIDKHIQ